MKKFKAMMFGLAFLALVFGSVPVRAMDIYVTSYPTPVKPGDEFTVSVVLILDGFFLGSYRLPILYDRSVLRLTKVFNTNVGANEFVMPIWDEMPYFPGAEIRDENANFVNCLTTGMVNLVNLTFRVLDTAPPGKPVSIQIGQDLELYDCLGVPIHEFLPPYPWGSGYVQTEAFVPGPAGVAKFLDMDDDGLFTETDAVKMRRLITGNITADDSALLGLNGRQCDINGNAIADEYDVGRMDALVRPVRTINAGQNGICETVAQGDDIQEIGVGHGVPNAVVIEPGFDYILQSIPAGDDQISGFRILAGPDGIAQTQALGNDVQVIPVGSGEPRAVCVSPGPDQELDTLRGEADDTVVEDQKNTPNLLNAYPQKGMPAKLKRVNPPQEPLYLDQIQPVPITVAVLDNNDRPKLGISPKFRVEVGAGYFDTGESGGATVVTNLPTDRYGPKAGIPKGEVTAFFIPAPGYNEIKVSLAGDPSKGIMPPPPITFSIWVLNQEPIPPDSFTISANPVSAWVGETINLTLTIKHGSTPIHGLASRIKMLSERNLEKSLEFAEFGEERYRTIFRDNFETGDLSGGGYGPWEVVSGNGNLAVNNSYPGLFGQYSVRAIVYDNPAPMLWRAVNTTGSQDIQVSFQWAFVRNPTNPSFDVHFITEYSLDGTHWRKLKDITGDGLMQGNGVWMTERINLRGVQAAAGATIFIRFKFNVGNRGAPQTIYLDNVNVGGKQVQFWEDFESYAPWEYPGSFDYATFINTGADGILQTSAEGDDVSLIERGHGKPYAIIIYPGPNGENNSLPAGDDQTGAGNRINAGPNGIAETTAQGDDVQVIPVGKGEPFAEAILPGVNLTLQSPVSGDDQVIGSIGHFPKISVDDHIYPEVWDGQGNNGSMRFLFIGREQAGATVEDYSAVLRVNLEGMDQALLSFFVRTASLVDFAAPGDGKAQEFSVDVSDNGGKSWHTVWNNAGQEFPVWTEQRVYLYNDGRFNLENDFLIRWRASVNSIETNLGDQDAVFIDDVSLTAIEPPVDVFGPVIDTMDGYGHYTVTLTSMVPGNTVRISAIYWPNQVDSSAALFPLFASPPISVNFNLHKVDQSSLKIMPETFTLKACQSMSFKVIGRYLDTPPGKVVDLTKFFRLKVHGPARETQRGVVTADCFTGETAPQIYINYIPLIPGIYDPGGGGGGEQTGDISGRIYKPGYTGAANAPIWVDLGGGNKIYGKTDSQGFLFFPDVPAGSNYIVESSLQGYTKKTKTGVNVTAGGNTSVSFTLLSGANFDGDAYTDTSDTDKDDDGVSDTTESSLGTSSYNPDSDGDGYPDNVDAFPNNASEWLDTDSDGTGNNADTDDDDDGISDSEEIIPGTDGYITDPLLWDTDGGGESDGHETANGRNPTSASDDIPQTDSDGDGIINVYETNTGVYVSPTNTGSNPNDADTDDDGLNDGNEVSVQSTNPNLADSDNDGLNDYVEVNWCTNPNQADTDGDGLSDGAEDADHDGVVDTGETDPCEADTDDDTIPDGYEVTYGLNPRVNDATGDLDSDGLNNLAEFMTNTYANDWDTDNDGLPDGYEAQNMSRSPNPLSPTSATDGSADFDGDGNPNAHEYWNGSDPWTAEPMGYPGCSYWGDAGTGNGQIDPPDLVPLQSKILGLSADYSGVIPNTGETQDLNANSSFDPTDVSLLQSMILNLQILVLDSRPVSLAVVDSPSGSVQVGSTCHVTVQVVNGASVGTPGIGVVFEVVSGTATLLGGDGSNGGSSRYDLSGGSASGWQSRMVLRVDAAGTINLRARIPSCGSPPGYGRSCSEIVINPLIQIQTQ